MNPYEIIQNLATRLNVEIIWNFDDVSIKDRVLLGSSPTGFARVCKIKKTNKTLLEVSKKEIDKYNIEPILHELAHVVIGFDNCDKQELDCYNLQEEWANSLFSDHLELKEALNKEIQRLRAEF